MDKRIEDALAIAVQFGGVDGDHHKAWVIDQMVRALTGCPLVTITAVDCRGNPYTFESMSDSKEYFDLIRDAKDGNDGPDSYGWNVGVAP